MIEQSDIAFTIILTTLLILLLIAGITIAFFMIGRQRTKQKIELSEAKLRYEKELRQMELEVGEHMRQHFAQELHDNIGHEITCIRLALENHKLDNPNESSALDVVDNHISKASSEIKLLSRSLNGNYLIDLGLNDSIKLELERQKELKLFHVHYEDGYQTGFLDKNQELVAFRIFQEILSNTMQHAKASNVHVILTCEPTFTLKVKDDGKGFVLGNIMAQSIASGVKNIFRRSELAGFSCDLKTAEGAGCQYSFQLIEQQL